MRNFIAEHEFIFVSAILYLAMVFFVRVYFGAKHLTAIPGASYSGIVLVGK